MNKDYIIKYEIFLSPGFIIALLLLIANDYFLKQNFPGWLTGKLSDFSGLFLFSLLLSAFFPSKNRHILLLCAILFLFWKSPLSQIVIDSWNKLFSLKIARVVDYSDLLAVAILPLSRKYFISIKPPPAKKILACPILMLSLLAIMGTSVIRPSYTVKLQMQKEKQDVSSSVIAEDGISTIIDTNEKISSIATNYGLSCSDCRSDKNYRRYENNGITLETNFDGYSRTLFVSILGFNPEINKKTVDQIQESIYLALHSNYKNITVQRAAIRYNPESDIRIRRIQITTPLKKFPLPSWCESSIKGNSDLMLSYSEVTDYALEKKFDNASKIRCHIPGDECMQQLCRQYVFGRVIGADEFDRSTSLRLGFSYGWTQTSLDIIIVEHAKDYLVNIDIITSELLERIQNQLSSEAEIKIHHDE